LKGGGHSLFRGTILVFAQEKLRETSISTVQYKCH